MQNSPTVSSGYHTDTERNSEESLAKGHVTSNKGHVTFDEEVEEFIYRDMSKEDKKGLRRNKVIRTSRPRCRAS